MKYHLFSRLKASNHAHSNDPNLYSARDHAVSSRKTLDKIFQRKSFHRDACSTSGNRCKYIHRPLSRLPTDGKPARETAYLLYIYIYIYVLQLTKKISKRRVKGKERNKRYFKPYFSPRYIGAIFSRCNFSSATERKSRGTPSKKRFNDSAQGI